MPTTNPRYPNLQEEVRPSFQYKTAFHPLTNQTLNQRQQFQSQPSQGKSQGQGIAQGGHPHPQEDFEQTMDQQGNLVSDEYSFTDGGKKKGHSGQDDEADLFDAAQADFDDL